MACPEHWSNKDEYGIYSDCHVWTPYFTISDSILILCGIVNGIIAAVKHFRGRGTLCKYMGAHSFFLIINSIMRLSTGWTTIDKKVVLNGVLGLSLAFFWCGLILYVAKYLELVMMTKRLRGVSADILARTRWIWTGLLLFCFITNLTSMVGPSVNSNLKFVPLNWFFNIARGNVITGIFLIIGFKVRSILNSMQLSRTFYQVLRRRLDLMMLSFVAFDAVVTFFVAMCFTVQTFVHNQYILTPIFLFVVNILCFVILVVTQAPRPDDDDSSHENRSRSNTAQASSRAQNPASLNSAPQNAGARPAAQSQSGREPHPHSQTASTTGTVIDPSLCSPTSSEIASTGGTPVSPYKYSPMNTSNPTSTTPSPMLRPFVADLFPPSLQSGESGDTTNDETRTDEQKLMNHEHTLLVNDSSTRSYVSSSRHNHHLSSSTYSSLSPHDHRITGGRLMRRGSGIEREGSGGQSGGEEKWGDNDPERSMSGSHNPYESQANSRRASVDQQLTPVDGGEGGLEIEMAVVPEEGVLPEEGEVSSSQRQLIVPTEEREDWTVQ